ncbi:MAG: N-6 DNA methylase [Bacteroidales bacterium]|nr:N-6 DNA methylase [Bacteroidales bacterium]
MEAVKVQKQDGKKYAPLKDSRVSGLKEETIRQLFIDRLVSNYSYSLDQITVEYRIKQSHYRPDIVIWKNALRKDAFIVVELKSNKTTSFKEESYSIGYKTSVALGAHFFVITNLEVIQCFYVNRVTGNLDPIDDIPKANEIVSDERIEDYVATKRVFSKDEFAKVLFICHNIIRNNDKLSPEAAFDEICKILFLKIINPQLLSLNEFGNYQHLFDISKEKFAKYNLFEINEEIKIREISFKQIVKELETINLSVTKDDVKGFAFEKLLGRTFRGELGQFFTPRNIVDFMVEVLDPQEGELICDPCCGSGGFLINAFEYIREKQGEQFTNTENFIYGTDANPRMARTAKMNMIIRGGDPSGIYHHDGLLNVDGIWDNRFDVILTNPPFGARVSNELVVAGSDRFTDEEKIKTYTGKYGQEYIDAQKQVNDHIGMPILSLFKTGRDMNCGLTDVLFIERCLNLLKPGGRLGIVLPESVLNNQNLQPVRDYFESIAKIILIVSLPQDVFAASGTSIKTSLVFFKKFTDAERRQYDDIKEKAIHTIRTKYDSNLSKAVENVEIRNIIKHEFKYPIVMSKIKSLSFDGTNDDLSALKEEFIKYRNSNNLW